MCDALNHAHKKGVIHRDLKPGNIMIVRDEENLPAVKILDFGLARLLPTDERSMKQQLTQPGTVFGTPHYMSPEQCMGVAVDARSDIYALGCIMYEALTGETAVQGDNFYQICQFHMAGAPLRFDTLLPRNKMPPAALEKVILKALQRKPEDRQRSMAQLKTELLEVLGPSRDSTRGPVRAAADDPAKGAFLDSEKDHTRVRSNRQPDEQERRLIRELNDAEKQFGLTSSETMPFLEALAQYYKDVELWSEAETTFRKLLIVASTKYGDQSLWCANVDEHLGFVTFMQERYDDALEHYEKSLNTHRQIKMKPDADVAWIDFFIYQTYDRLGEYERAASTLDRAIRCLQDFCPDGTERIIEWTTEAGRYCEKHQQDSYAEEYYLEALATAEKAYGERHEGLIEPNLVVADFYVLIGEREKAEPYYRRATNIAHKTLPPMDEKFATTLFKVGAFYYKQADYAKAKKCFRTTLSIDEHNRGVDSVENIYTLQYIGLILDTDGDHIEAEKCFLRSIAIAEEHEGPESAKLVSIKRDLGYCEENLRNYERAEKELRGALALAFTCFKEEKPDEVFHILMDLAVFLSRRKKFEQAETVFRDAIELGETVFGEDSYALVNNLEELAKVLKFTGRIDESLALEFRARKIQQNAG